MNSDQLKQIIIKHTHLIKITPSDLSKAFNNLTGEDLDYSKTYGDQGLDDLDLVELVMYLEKDLNIHIHDDIVDTLFSSESYPINMTLWNREERLVELGI
jgi:acyl carrier protein